MHVRQHVRPLQRRCTARVHPGSHTVRNTLLQNRLLFYLDLLRNSLAMMVKTMSTRVTLRIFNGVRVTCIP